MGEHAELVTRQHRPIEQVAGRYLAAYGPKSREGYRVALRRWIAWCEHHRLDPMAVEGAQVTAWVQEHGRPVPVRRRSGPLIVTRNAKNPPPA